jgi:hypothetical protein
VGRRIFSPVPVQTCPIVRKEPWPIPYMLRVWTRHGMLLEREVTVSIDIIRG